MFVLVSVEIKKTIALNYLYQIELLKKYIHTA